MLSFVVLSSPSMLLTSLSNRKTSTCDVAPSDNNARFISNSCLAKDRVLSSCLFFAFVAASSCLTCLALWIRLSFFAALSVWLAFNNICSLLNSLGNWFMKLSFMVNASSLICACNLAILVSSDAARMRLSR